MWIVLVDIFKDLKRWKRWESPNSCWSSCLSLHSSKLESLLAIIATVLEKIRIAMKIPMESTLTPCICPYILISMHSGFSIFKAIMIPSQIKGQSIRTFLPIDFILSRKFLIPLRLFWKNPERCERKAKGHLKKLIALSLIVKWGSSKDGISSSRKKKRKLSRAY